FTKICVTSGGQSWFILRRYKEFNNLYDRLKKQFPEAGLKLPGKRFFGNMDPEFIRQRQEGLDNMVQPEVIQFLGFDINKSRLELPDDAKKRHSVVWLGRAAHRRRRRCRKAALDPAAKEEEALDLGAKENRKATPSDFTFLKVIGKGSFGKVFLAKRKSDGGIFAVKWKHIMSERNVLVRNIEHPFLCALHMSFRTPDKLYFVLDYVNGGELFFHLQRDRCFPEPRARFYAAEIASAIGYLHSKNIIYSTWRLRCLRKEPYDFAVDWWLPRPPFYSRETSEMYNNILHKPLPVRSLAAQDILVKLLQKNKQLRLGQHLRLPGGAQADVLHLGVDWRLLDQRRIEPPFKPKVMSPLSTEYIDSEFTRARASQSAKSVKVSASVQEADHDFMGFSYVPPTLDDLFI
uniref:Serine/threonine-protein kinase Sgk1 n=1 Tax=Macrostomum lignano TaxID=282301 RepID=A0A1I8FPX7_9PLAT